MDKCCTKLHKSYQAGFIIPVSLYARYARCKRVQDHTMDAVAKTAATHNVQVCGRTLCNTQGLTTCCCRKHKASQRAAAANARPHYAGPHDAAVANTRPHNVQVCGRTLYTLGMFT